MSKEQYVSYEVAKLLKEKGFDWDTYHYYDEIGRTWFEDVLCDWNHRTTPEVSCPTQQMACRWLREEHNLHICVDIDTTLDWFYQVKSLTELVELDYPENKVYHNDSETGWSSCEQATEEALMFVLTKLI